MTTAIWWIRRDLRLADNQALAQAVAMSDEVVPVFILDPALLSSPHAGDMRIAFLYEGLRSLDKALLRRGSYLVLRKGKPAEELSKLAKEIEAQQIYAERNFSPYAARRDSLVQQQLPLKLVEGLTFHPPEAVRKADGSPYTVYTPFRRRWKELVPPGPNSLIPTPDHISTPAGIRSQPLPDRPALPGSVPFPAREKEAQRRLKEFVSGSVEAAIVRYGERRDRMDLAATSQLSPYLRFGMLSVRQAFLAAQEGETGGDSRKGPESWVNELIWREFYISILFHHPHVLKGSFRPVYDNIQWENNRDHFQAWCEGKTGYPVVDAAMRQLVQNGWMHNRARMITASFLVKDLLIDWRWGERYFMEHLIDGDPAANNGGWQWAAGTGTDAAPYFRIFNPVLQGKKFDPQGKYVRQWLPELAGVLDQFIHEPWSMPNNVQKEAGCVVGRHYPQPIVDHRKARERTLDAYARARDGEK